MPRSVLHCVAQAPPRQTGYTLRTQGLGRALVERGWSVTVADRVFHDGPPLPDRDGVAYLRPPRSLFGPSRWRTFRERLSRRGWALERRLRERALATYADWLRERAGPFALVHAHTPPEVGYEGARLARRLDLPLVYEVRGFWSLSKAAHRSGRVDPRRAVADDVRACARADRVVAIGETVAELLSGAGVDRARIVVAPNGVDAEHFRPRARDRDLAGRLGLDSRLVFGYATSVRRLEGVQVLAQAWPAVLRALPEALFLLAGDGDYLPVLRRRIRALGIEASFRCLGRLPHGEMGAFYSLLDLFVVPRLPLPVCEIVTPLKPLEAMAAGVPVLASDLPALREMVRPDLTGLLFRAGDPAAVAQACVALGRDEARRRELARRAREWVVRERSWSAVTEPYAALYAEVGR